MGIVADKTAEIAVVLGFKPPDELFESGDVAEEDCLQKVIGLHLNIGSGHQTLRNVAGYEHLWVRFYLEYAGSGSHHFQL
jgi:hypothetical protein